MRLPCDRKVIELLSSEELDHAIRERRREIRGPRDARMDDRCWVDDYAIWMMLDDTILILTPPADAMKRCELFFLNRRRLDPDSQPPDAIFNSMRWDEDLYYMNHYQLIEELMKIQEAIKVHRDIDRLPRTFRDDRMLYRVLPEKIASDFRLPSEADFLERAKAPRAGCPAFWESHGHCGTSDHNLHKWGPCKKAC